ncbi:Gfo/Idh/MocA family oxidoreductase [Brachybacterium sp. MASK1Z-5]|uniref:Gfo/Idh/MocA family oxidoreductase n=1 Tax=Brachybacterium halotolerans TaxID=2795215 RepID=A0ABS1B7Z4_9MICO|nr:Gfo/Idh/MocA family oxidoreductase [Brachybacterium halotolerans]MBK0330756.1 Gfo/Idh/MocA family oxidoreductase [Brachybacterium halotolerans]
MTSQNTPIRAGVVGIGWAGQQHMAAYDAAPGVELVAIAGMEDDVRAELSERYGIEATYRDWESMIARGDLDVVSVAVPTFLHAPIAIGALRAGAHVLSEKPIARTGEEGQAMVDAAREAGRVLEVVFNHRRRGDIEAIAAAVEDGTVGRPYHARAMWLRRAGIPALGSWFTNAEMSGGGPLVDLGVHVLDWTLHIMGEPRVTAVSAVTHAELGPRGLGGAVGGAKSGADSAYEVEDLASALLRLEGGGSIMLETSWAAHRATPDEFGITLYGTDGGADLKVEGYAPSGELTLFTGDGEDAIDTPITAPEGRGHGAVVERFLEHVRDEASWAQHDGGVGLSRARIVDACYASARQGREVRLDENGEILGD